MSIHCAKMVILSSGLETVPLELLEVNIHQDSLNSRFLLCFTEQLKALKKKKKDYQAGLGQEAGLHGALPTLP